MRDYLFHALDRSGARLDACAAAFDDDVGAMRHALGGDFPHGCEVWCGYRLVGRFCGPAPRPKASAPELAA